MRRRRNREIEKKFIVDSASYNEAVLALMPILNHSHSIENTSADLYWHTPTGLKADFIRLRFMPEGDGQITAKFADGNSNVDRVEIDLGVDDPLQAKRFLQFTMGKAVANITKKYYVFFLGSQHDTVSVYQVENDSRVFIEVEASTLEKVDQLVKTINKKVAMTLEKRSLYQIFVKGGQDEAQNKK